MKLKINFIMLAAYLLGISLLLKKFEWLPLLMAGLLFAFDKKISDDIKNLLYIIVALIPFLPFLYIFLIYLPFSAFGAVLDNPNFIKRYLFGFSISIFATLLLYTISMFFNFPLNIVTILLAFYLPALAMLIVAYRKKNLGFLRIDPDDYKIIIVSLLFLFFVANVMLTDNTLFMSNGTYFYSKYYTIVKSIGKYNDFPFYSPNSAQGEQLFLVDSPAMFSHIAFVKTIIPWTNPVLFYNYISAFILFLTILGASLLIRECNKDISPYLAALGSCAIGLSFIFVQFLESFKHFFAHPIGFLVFAMVLANPRNVKELIIIASLMALAFLIHAPQSLAIWIMAFLLFAIMQFSESSMMRNFGEIRNYISKNKLKTIAVFLAVLLIPLFYIIPAVYYSEFMRHTDVKIGDYPTNMAAYLKVFFISENPISIKYPDLRRIDDKKIGLFISAFGALALFYSLLNMRKPHFRNANAFALAFLLSAFLSALIVNFPFINNMEYGTRTLPYELVLLVIVICCAISSFRHNALKLALAVIFLIGFMHSLPFVKANLSNIHSESFIGGQTYKNEIEFIKKLPTDGRIITYGHFANAVDAGLHALTDRYLSRYEFKQIDSSRTVYEKIHTSYSWGNPETLQKLTDTEFANYLAAGGYKYLFLNVCHPSGSTAAKKVYPNFSYPIYQSQCNVFLVVNNSNYAEKVNVVDEEEEKSMKEKENGYLYVSVKNLEYAQDSRINNPEPLGFERPEPSLAIIKGDFKSGEWIVFKEQYFPRWKGYADGKELPVMATNSDLILVRAAEGDRIILKNSLLPIEKISGFLSSAGIILFLVFLMLMA